MCFACVCLLSAWCRCVGGALFGRVCSGLLFVPLLVLTRFVRVWVRCPGCLGFEWSTSLLLEPTLGLALWFRAPWFGGGGCFSGRASHSYVPSFWYVCAPGVCARGTSSPCGRRPPVGPPWWGFRRGPVPARDAHAGIASSAYGAESTSRGVRVLVLIAPGGCG